MKLLDIVQRTAAGLALVGGISCSTLSDISFDSSGSRTIKKVDYISLDHFLRYSDLGDNAECQERKFHIFHNSKTPENPSGIDYFIGNTEVSPEYWKREYERKYNSLDGLVPGVFSQTLQKKE